MANPDRARKLLIRTALVTSSTIATMFGAQNLALLDGAKYDVVDESAVATDPAAQIVDQTAQLIIPSTVNSVQAAPSLTINKASPNFVILRHATVNTTAASQSTAQIGAQNTAMVIQPPVPSQLASPVVVQQTVQQGGQQTVAVQQPARPRTRASR